LDTNFAGVGGLTLPKRLLALIGSGLWPCTGDNPRQQSLKSVVAKERIQLFAPGEDEVYLYSPPFSTIAGRVAADKADFWSRFGALEQITPELCVDIGDLGAGSDSAIVLDYSEGPFDPSVIRLQWRKTLRMFGSAAQIASIHSQTCSGWTIMRHHSHNRSVPKPSR